MGYYTRYSLSWEPLNGWATAVSGAKPNDPILLSVEDAQAVALLSQRPESERVADYEKLQSKLSEAGRKYIEKFILPVSSLDERIALYIRQGNNRKQEFYAITENGDTSDSCKWYDHEERMMKMSQDFPDVLFTLYGEGEESGDIWRKYFLNGKMQVAKAKLTFDDYDPSKLQ